jgi:hypothetical protein
VEAIYQAARTGREVKISWQSYNSTQIACLYKYAVL